LTGAPEPPPASGWRAPEVPVETPLFTHAARVAALAPACAGCDLGRNARDLAALACVIGGTARAGCTRRTFRIRRVSGAAGTKWQGKCNKNAA